MILRSRGNKLPQAPQRVGRDANGIAALADTQSSQTRRCQSMAPHQITEPLYGLVSLALPSCSCVSACAFVSPKVYQVVARAHRSCRCKRSTTTTVHNGHNAKQEANPISSPLGLLLLLPLPLVACSARREAKRKRGFSSGAAQVGALVGNQDFMDTRPEKFLAAAGAQAALTQRDRERPAVPSLRRASVFSFCLERWRRWEARSTGQHLSTFLSR